jgi:hypothetical protein
MLQIFDYQLVPFWLIVAASFTCPMQGLANLLVYFYPKYMKLRKRNKETGTPLNVWKWINAGMQTSSVVVNNQRQHHDGDEEVGNKEVIKPPGAEASTAEKAIPSTEEGTSSLPNALKKDQANASYMAGLNPAPKRKINGHCFAPTMSSITISGALSEAEGMIEGQDTDRPVAPLARQSPGLPSTSSVTLSELEPTEEMRRYLREPRSEIDPEDGSTPFSTEGKKLPPPTPRRYPSEASGADIDGGPRNMGSQHDRKEDGRTVLGRRVSFEEEDHSIWNSQHYVDQSPKLPNRNVCKFLHQKDVGSETTSLVPITGILRISNRESALDSTPGLPRRTVSHGSEAGCHISDNHDNAHGRCVLDNFPKAIMKRQTLTATSDSTPKLPQHPVSDTSLVEETEETQISARASPKPLSSFKQRQVSIDSDSSPMPPKRHESNASQLEDDGYQRRPTLPKPLKATKRQTSNRSDSTPSLPSRPASDASQIEENDDHPPVKSFPKPLSSAKRREVSIDSDSTPVLPRRPQSDASQIEEGNHEPSAEASVYSERSQPWPGESSSTCCSGQLPESGSR